MALRSLLLQGGTLLIHDDDDHVKSIKADPLIEGNKISKIEPKIQAPSDVEVIDCTDKLLSPGFIDTHHHVWQTLAKGRHADQLLLDYIPSGNLISQLHSAEDIFWSQLGGCLEALDAGTTTIVDHAHMVYSPDHPKAALAATISSGVRLIYGFCPTPQLESWAPLTLGQDLLADWVMESMEELASKSSFGDGRVELGLAFDGFFLPKEVVVGLFKKVKELGMKLITLHMSRSAIFGQASVLELLESYSLLDSTILISHATNASQDDAALVLKSGAHISSTPSTELQMALGTPVAFSPTLGIQHQCSVGIGCHSNASASIVSEMRLLLQSARGMYNDSFVTRGLNPKKINKTVEEAFNLGTISGARAVNKESEIGSLKVGKNADVLIWDKLSPGMVCAAEQDPVAAIVLHSSPKDLETVIVDGIVRKMHGMLVDVNVEDGKDLWNGTGKEKLQWKDVAKELVKRRLAFQEKAEKIDMIEARKGVIKAFYIDESKFVESV